MKYFLSMALLLLIFVIGTGVLLKQFLIYRKAYQELGKHISHSSIEWEMIFEEEE